MVLAEDLPTPQAYRYVPVILLPALPSGRPGRNDSNGEGEGDGAARYGVTVIRTLTPIKAYLDLHSHVGSGSAIAFNPAWAGAITEGIEATSHITRDADDPSPHLAAWDKAVCQTERVRSRLRAASEPA